MSYYTLAVIVDPVDLEDRAEVESEHFVRTAGSVYLDSGANNQDQSPQREARVTTDQVSVHLWCPSSFAPTATSDSSDAGIACPFERLKPQTWWIETEKEKGNEDMRKTWHECVGGRGFVIERLWLKCLRAR